MTKQALIDLLKLLSALESMLVYRQPGGPATPIPDYILESLDRNVLELEREILK